MSLTTNAALAAILANATSKQDWCNKVQSALTNTRRLTAYRDSNASAANPAATGTKFLDVGMTGALVFASGNISGFGSATGTTTRLTADLLTGASVLRIEGGGNYMQYTLGLTRAAQSALGVSDANLKDYDFAFAMQPTATSGIGFSSAASAKAPRLLASGTGPAAPAFQANTPVRVVLEDWSNPSAPVDVGTVHFNNRIDDWVYEDAELAAENGDFAVVQSTEMVVFGKFEFGAMLLMANQYNAMDGNTPIERVVCAFKPHNRWSSYPAMDTYVQSTNTQTGTDPETAAPIYTSSNPDVADSTYPTPFKVRLENAAGTKVGYLQMDAFNAYPDLPINSPQFSQQTRDSAPLIPHFNCGQWLVWHNTQTRKSALAGKYISGVTSDSIRATIAKAGGSSNPSVPLFTTDQVNSINQMFALPPYPMRSDPSNGTPPSDVTAYDPGPVDPNLFPESYSGDGGRRRFRLTGWKYQAGSITGHDWRTGPGGNRFDRMPIASSLMLYATNSNFIRPKGAVPIRTFLDNFAKALFNHPNHWVRDVRTFATIPKEEIDAGSWVFKNAYYGGGPYGQAGQFQGPQNTIDLLGPANATTTYAGSFDATNRLPWGGWQRDNLHSYTSAAEYAIMLNDPAYAVAATHDYNTQWIASLASAPATTSPRSFFMVRIQAWRWKAYVNAWKLGTQHPLGRTQLNIENRFQVELETMYDQIYLPTFGPNPSSDPYFVGLRNLGTPASLHDSGTLMTSPGGTLGLYMGHVLVLMRQYGLWAKMKAKNNKCKLALEMMITCFDKFTIDYILDTDGRDAFYPVMSATKPAGYVFTATDIPANWAAQKVIIDANWPTTGGGPYWNANNGFFSLINGGKGEQTNSQHLMRQWVHLRQDYFPEYANSRLAAAVAKYESLYSTWASTVTSSGTDFTSLHPGLGVLLPPTSLGPN